jgi:hypothetical protein
MMPPRSLTSCSSLPPEGAARLRPGEAGSAARTGKDGATTLVAAWAALLDFGRSFTPSYEDFP